MSRAKVQGTGMTSQRTRDRLVERLRERCIRHEGVLEAIRTTPRHLFMDEALASYAYEDKSLPIGFGQTISQPYVVARMSEALLNTGSIPRRVLEVGTGSGYQAAVLAKLVAEVYTVERIQALASKARERLRYLRVDNVLVKYSDGNEGWSDYAPYDGILVTAGSREIPQPLLGQLAVGGRMVIPLGVGSVQELTLIIRGHSGLEHMILDRVRFVPLREGAA
jgi:protein-L-isoaspartate(D-aspartate) O-methyltransferase